MNNAIQAVQAEFLIDTSVVCEDGDLGPLRRVVIDPIARAVTRLVIEPQHRQGVGHLVPVELVAASSPTESTLSCSAAEFAALERAEDVHFHLGGSGASSYQQAQMMISP